MVTKVRRAANLCAHMGGGFSWAHHPNPWSAQTPKRLGHHGFKILEQVCVSSHIVAVATSKPPLPKSVNCSKYSPVTYGCVCVWGVWRQCKGQGVRLNWQQFLRSTHNDDHSQKIRSNPVVQALTLTRESCIQLSPSNASSCGHWTWMIHLHHPHCGPGPSLGLTRLLPSLATSTLTALLTASLAGRADKSLAAGPANQLGWTEIN